jgi:hypothetical protein
MQTSLSSAAKDRNGRGGGGQRGGREDAGRDGARFGHRLAIGDRARPPGDRVERDHDRGHRRQAAVLVVGNYAPELGHRRGRGAHPGGVGEHHRVAFPSEDDPRPELGGAVLESEEGPPLRLDEHVGSEAADIVGAEEHEPAVAVPGQRS